MGRLCVRQVALAVEAECLVAVTIWGKNEKSDRSVRDRNTIAAVIRDIRSALTASEEGAKGPCELAQTREEARIPPRAKPLCNRSCCATSCDCDSSRPAHG